MAPSPPSANSVIAAKTVGCGFVPRSLNTAIAGGRRRCRIKHSYYSDDDSMRHWGRDDAKQNEAPCAPCVVRGSRVCPRRPRGGRGDTTLVLLVMLECRGQQTRGMSQRSIDRRCIARVAYHWLWCPIKSLLYFIARLHLIPHTPLATTSRLQYIDHLRTPRISSTPIALQHRRRPVLSCCAHRHATYRRTRCDSPLLLTVCPSPCLPHTHTHTHT